MASHAIQYQAPLYRTLSAREDLDLTVFFCERWGAETYMDREFGTPVKWDNPVLEGFPHRFVRNWSPFPSTARFFGLFNPGLLLELIRGRYDAVVVPGYALLSYWIAYLGARLSGTPVFFRGETVLRGGDATTRRGLKRLLLRRLIRATAAFLTIGTRSRDFYLEFGATADRLFFTPYTVDNEFFMREACHLAPLKSSLKRQHGVREGEPIILFVGKLVARKRPADIIEALRRLKAGAALIFVGDGILRRSLEDRASDLGGAKVFFVGFKNQSELPAFYVMADVLVLPSDYEVAPLVLNEAMCSGLPILVSDAVPSAVDLVRAGENGYTYTCGNISALVERLEAMLESPERLRAMGARSRELIQAWNNECVAAGVCAALERFGRGERA